MSRRHRLRRRSRGVVIGDAGELEPYAEDRSPCFPVGDCDRSAVSIDDPAHDGQAKPGAADSTAIPSPKSAENQLALRERDAGPFVADPDAAAAIDTDFNRCARRAYDEGHSRQGCEWRAGSFRHCLSPRPAPQRRSGPRFCFAAAPVAPWPHDFAADRGQIGLFGLGDDRNVEFGNLQQLVDDATHGVDVMMQLMKQCGIRQCFQTRPKDGKRSAQFMRRVGGKFPLYPEPRSSRSSAWLTASTSGRISLGIFGSWNTNIGPHRSDVLGVLRSLDQRPHGAAEDDDIGGQQQQQDRQRDPAHAQEEIGDDSSVNTSRCERSSPT